MRIYEKTYFGEKDGVEYVLRTTAGSFNQTRLSKSIPYKLPSGAEKMESVLVEQVDRFMPTDEEVQRFFDENAK